MDQPPSKRRFRFGLRSLLLLVVVCAFALAGLRASGLLAKYRFSQVKPGMTRAEVRATVGLPVRVYNYSREGEFWSYYEGVLTIEGDVCVGCDPGHRGTLVLR